jgi:hypothetical protein
MSEMCHKPTSSRSHKSISGSVQLTALSPVNVISPIEGDDHHARRLALAGELMWHVAPHHGKSACPEPRRWMAGHLGQDRATNDNELLFGCMVVPRHDASGGAFKIKVEGPLVGSPVSSAEDRHFTSLSGKNRTDERDLIVPIAASSASAGPLMKIANHAISFQFFCWFISNVQNYPPSD